MYLFFKVKIYEWLEQRRVAKVFYHNDRFKERDLALLCEYRSKNPYQISKEFLKTHCYGETPLTSVAHIVKECGLSSADTLIEMGAGRGRASLFLAEYVGCRVIAYEQIPAFVEKFPSSPNIKILSQDMFSGDFSKGTAIYLYGTMLTDQEIQKLCTLFPPKVKIITVSYPLSDYSDHYVVKKVFTVKFPWGKTEGYWNERTS
ncbi:MAG: class I SAM-dependent methyltransferase [Verrucomicrobia bacterium]|nr:class I SAM-dependent methyltransferase [Verrucomicrobiota bacterium]